MCFFLQIVRTAASLHAKSFTREGLTKEDWKKAGLDEQEDPEVAERKEPAEPSSVEELGMRLLALQSSNVYELGVRYLECDCSTCSWSTRYEL